MSRYFIKKKREEVDFEEILLDEKNKDSGKIDNYFDAKKIRQLQGFFLLIILVLFSQLAYLQFIKGDFYSCYFRKELYSHYQGAFGARDRL